tara:strand:+ start:3229 stop:4536 length:1308 start_codon:yes stop_codon:yes gene_type:complete
MSATTATTDYKTKYLQQKARAAKYKAMGDDLTKAHHKTTEHHNSVITDLKTKHSTTSKNLDNTKNSLNLAKLELEASIQGKHAFHTDLLNILGLDDDATDRDILSQVENIAEEASSEQTQKDALRMLGELQVKYNLLQEQMDRIRVEGYKVSKSKKGKGLSQGHRKEKVSVGVLECFQEDRCCAMVWANGLGSQCSRHWSVKGNPEGEDTKMCKTHGKHLNGNIYQGSFGLYHRNRPTIWGEHGLKVDTSTYKVGNKISWKMKAPEYDAEYQGAEFQASIPTLPNYLYPTEEQQFGDDSESEDESDMEVSADDASSDEEEQEQVEDVPVKELAEVEDEEEEAEDDTLTLEPVVDEEHEAMLAQIAKHGCAETDDEEEQEDEERCQNCHKLESEFDQDDFDGPAITTFAVNGQKWCADCISDACSEDESDDEEEVA